MKQIYVKNLLKDGFDFIREHRAILYSLGLLIIIPVLLFLQTFFVLKTFQTETNQVIRTKGRLAEEVMEIFVADTINNKLLLQSKVEKLTSRAKDIADLTIVTPVPRRDAFQVIASSDPSSIDTLLSSPLITLAWSQKTAPDGSIPGVATIIREGSDRFWFVAKRIENEQGEKVAIISMALPLSEVDTTLTMTILKSYLMLGLIMALLIMLVVVHGKLFSYVTLFRHLRDLNRLKDEFISIASHELRTPITAIQGYLSMILEGSLGKMDKRIEEALKEVQRANKHLHTLIEDILDVSRIEQGRIKLELAETNINEIIEEVAKDLTPKAQEKNLALKVNLPEQALPSLELDQKRIRQILVNLVGNAIKYTLQGEINITVKYDEAKKEVLISVKDTGVGMSAREREALFQKFYRIRDEKTRQITGTGLGLWITKQLVEMMGGKIYVDSLPGVGSEFTIVFPVLPEKKGS